MPKTLLRKILHERRKKIPARVRLKKSRRIFRKLFSDPHFSRAAHAALYYGVVPEVETRPFLKGILRTKELYLPRVDLRGKGLALHRVRSLADLEKGAYGIMEPKTTCPKRNAACMDVIVVPGVGFDPSGRRLGRGGGHYDRILCRAKKVYKIGLCFREQLAVKIPVKKHDVGMDRVITD